MYSTAVYEQSLIVVIGMEVLEEQLIQKDDGGARSAKHGRHEAASVSQDIPLWIELARPVLCCYALAHLV